MRVLAATAADTLLLEEQMRCADVRRTNGGGLRLCWCFSAVICSGRGVRWASGCLPVSLTASPLPRFRPRSFFAAPATPSSPWSLTARIHPTHPLPTPSTHPYPTPPLTPPLTPHPPPSAPTTAEIRTPCSAIVGALAVLRESAGINPESMAASFLVRTDGHTDREHTDTDIGYLAVERRVRGSKPADSSGEAAAASPSLSLLSSSPACRNHQGTEQHRTYCITKYLPPNSIINQSPPNHHPIT